MELNRYFEAHYSIDTDVLYIDGTKFEANANKMTFVWMKATKKFRERRWSQIMDRLKSLNAYCKEHNIELFMKYSTYAKEQEKATDKNRFKNYNMNKPDEDGKIRCPAGHAFTLVEEKTDWKGRYPRTVKTYRNEHCTDCLLRDRCTKSKYGRTLNICE